MAHPLNRPRYDDDAAARRRRLRHPAAARRGEPARRQPLAVRAPVRRRAGHRSLHARGLRRLPGPVRRRLVHRQGHLRRRCVRARAGGPLSREPHPQPRPARRLLRALGAGQRRAAVRGLSVALQRRRRAAGIAGSAATGRSPAGCCARVPGADGRARAQSALAAVAVEDLRQPAPQPGARRRCCCCCCSAGRVLAPAWWWTLAVLGILLVPPLIASLRRPAAQARRRAARAASRLHVAHAAARRAAQIAVRAGLPAVRGVASALDAIVRTHWRMLVTRRRLLEWTPSSEQDRARSHDARAPRSRAMWIAPVVAVAAGACSVLARLRPRCRSPRRSCCCGSSSPVLAWWLSRPLRAARREAARREQIDLPAQARAPDLGVLRDVRRRRGSLAAARQLPGRSRRRDRAPHVADQHGPGAARQPGGVRLRLSAGRPAARAHRRNTLRHDGSRSSGYRGHFYNWYDTRTLQPLRAALRLDGRQRQPRRPPADAARRAARVCPTTGSWSRGSSPGCVDTARVLVEALGADVPPAVARARPRSRCRLRRPAGDGRRGAPLARPALPRPSRPSSRIGAPTAPRQRRGGRTKRTRGCARWRRNAERRCDELTLFAPWLQQPDLERAAGRASARWRRSRRCASSRDLMPTLSPQIERAARRRSDRCRAWQRSTTCARARAAPARARRSASRRSKRLAAQCDGARAHGLRLPVRPRRATCSRSATTSTSAGATRASTTCSPPRRGLASFVAIAQGQVPQESWFALGRLLTTAGDRPMLLSWSGSMFEYLMPLLVMPTYENTLLDETCRAAVERQIEYGRQRGVPWGMSESGYNTVDAQPQLSVPRVRRAGARAQARARRGPRRSRRTRRCWR